MEENKSQQGANISDMEASFKLHIDSHVRLGALLIELMKNNVISKEKAVEIMTADIETLKPKESPFK